MNKASIFYYVNSITLLVVIGLAIIWIPLATVTASAGQEEEGDWLTYENEDLGFSIQYPPNWTVEEGEDLVELRSSDDGGTLRFEITSESLPEEGTTLKEYSDMRVNDLGENTEDFKLLHSSSTTIGAGDYPARKVIYKLTVEGTESQNTVTRFWTIQNDKAYSIAYIGAEPKYFNSYGIAQKMFDSFQIKK
jgi:hypothetical protein